MEVSAIKNVSLSRVQLESKIDTMIESAQEKPAPLNSLAKGRAGAVAPKEEEIPSEDKVVLDLQTSWPIVKAIFTFVRPFLVFKPKWKTIVDRFIAGLDVIIPEKE